MSSGLQSLRIPPQVHGYEPRCATCDDTGWRPVTDARGIGRVVRCTCAIKQPRAVDGLPAVYATATLKTFETRPGSAHAADEAVAFLAGTHDLYLWGPIGSGKTRLAATIARARAEVGRAVAFRDVPTLMRRLLSAEFSRRDPEWDDPVDLLHAVDLLVLDDVGADNGSDFTRRELQTIYTARLASGRRTIWTSNLDLDALAQFYGDDRISSRITGAARVVVLEADDYRARGPKEDR